MNASNRIGMSFVRLVRLDRRPRPTTRAASLVCALLLTAVATQACGDGSRTEPYPARRVTPGKANLPPTPELQPKLPPDQWPDGAWSVHGLLEADRAKLPKRVSVRGYVATLHICPAGQRSCNPAPYLHLTDDETLQGKRLLVGGDPALGMRGFAMAEPATIEGSLATSSSDGLYFAPQGLLLIAPPIDPDATDGDAEDAGGN